MLAYLLQITAEEHREALARIYEKYERLTWTTTGRFFREEDRRLEAFQRSWLRVVEYAEKIFSISAGKLPGYLVIIVKNVCRTKHTGSTRHTGGTRGRHTGTVLSCCQKNKNGAKNALLLLRST